MKTTVFIGKTGLLQRALTLKAHRLVERIRSGEEVPVGERRMLFTGPPGTGKTHLACQLACDLLESGHVNKPRKLPLNCEHRNGGDVTVEVVREWNLQDCYRPMEGLLAVKFVDEIDGIGASALNSLRTYLDNLADHRVFLATTNLKVKDLQEQLQSRFQVFEFAPVTTSEIAAHLAAKYRLDPPACQRIASGASGNVPAAEADAITELDARAIMPAAVAA
jgi:DNA polymerase III delta prime subunit